LANGLDVFPLLEKYSEYISLLQKQNDITKQIITLLEKQVSLLNQMIEIVNK